MIVGITTVAVFSQRRGYRLGGVMAIPLLAIYTLREPFSPVIYAVGVVGAWVGLWFVREYTLNHGRRVFLVAVVAGVCATVPAAFVIDTYTPAHLPFREAEVVASIFPGVTAYNTMRVDEKDRLADIVGMTVLLGGLLVVGVGALAALEGRAIPTQPVLALSSSDLVTALGIDPRGRPTPQIVPDWLSLALLVVDVAVYEAVRKRYDLRLLGIIVVPLVAVFSVRFEYAVAVFAAGTVTTFALIAIVHWLSLLYGRVLLAVSLVVGLAYTLVLGAVVDGAVPGITLFFTGLLVGVAAYNMYRVAPRIRAASLRTSAGLFVVSYAAIVAVVDVPSGGLAADGSVWYLVAAVCTLGLTVLELLRLEGSRPPVAEFAGSSVFADVETADADADADTPDSPFAVTEGVFGRWANWLRSVGGDDGRDRTTQSQEGG